MPLTLCEHWKLGTHRRGFMGLVEDMYPSTSWMEWAQWFPCWEDGKLRSLLKEVHCKRKQVEHLLAAKEEEDRRIREQSTLDVNQAAFLKGVSTGLTIVGGVIEMTKMIGDIPLTTMALRFNLDKLLQVQALVEQEIQRRNSRESTFSNSSTRN